MKMSKLLESIRAKKLADNKVSVPSDVPVVPAGASDNSEVATEGEEPNRSCQATLNCTRELEEKLENIKLEEEENTKLEENVEKVAEEKKDEDIKRDENVVEDEEVRRKVKNELRQAREKLRRARSHKEILEEIYEDKNKNDQHSGSSFEVLREEYVRCFVKRAEQHQKLYNSRTKLRNLDQSIGNLQWEIDSMKKERITTTNINNKNNINHKEKRNKKE